MFPCLGTFCGTFFVVKAKEHKRFETLNKLMKEQTFMETQTRSKICSSITKKQKKVNFAWVTAIQ